MDKGGLVINGLVEQEEMLTHPAASSFVSDCGWNLLTEAAMVGTRVLGWPRGGDQKVNVEEERAWYLDGRVELEGGVVRALESCWCRRELF